MQPQEVLDLFQSYKAQAEFDIQKDSKKFNEKKHSNKTFAGFLEFLVTDEHRFSELIKMNQKFASIVKFIEPEDDAFPSLLKAQDQIKILRRDMGEADHFNSI